MPPAPISVGDIVQVVCESRVLNQVCLNVLYYRARKALPAISYAEGIDLLNQAVGGASEASIKAQMVPLMGDNTKFIRVQAQRVYPTRDLYYRLTMTRDGMAPTVCNASNIAAVITKRGLTAGRGKAGSFHLAGLTDQHYALGSLTEEGTDLMERLADKLNDPLVSDGGEFVFEPGMFTPGAGAGLNWNYIGACDVQPTVRVMRRRTVGLGI